MDYNSALFTILSDSLKSHIEEDNYYPIPRVKSVLFERKAQSNSALLNQARAND